MSTLLNYVYQVSLNIKNTSRSMELIKGVGNILFLAIVISICWRLTFCKTSEYPSCLRISHVVSSRRRNLIRSLILSESKIFMLYFYTISIIIILVNIWNLIKVTVMQKKKKKKKRKIFRHHKALSWRIPHLLRFYIPFL